MGVVMATKSKQENRKNDRNVKIHAQSHLARIN
jgi:hypothetical protein